MYSDKTKDKYLKILNSVHIESKKHFTLDELSKYLEVSKPTLVSFFKGRVIRFDLLEQVSSMIGYGEFDFEITRKNYF
jgi:hypothetical protein